MVSVHKVDLPPPLLKLTYWLVQCRHILSLNIQSYIYMYYNYIVR